MQLDYSVERDADERMSEPAMVSEPERRTAKAAQYVQVGRFGGERERERGQRGLAVEPGTSHARAGQKVSDRFQALRGFYRKAIFPARCATQRGGASRLSAFGTTVISAGSVPSSSPSAST